MTSQNTLERRLMRLLQPFDNFDERLQVLRAVINDTDRGAIYKVSLLKKDYQDLEANNPLISVCNQWIEDMSRCKQLTIFDALGGGAAS